MIVCSCNTIDHHELERAVERLFESDPYRLLTPVLVYKALGKRPQCGCCLSMAASVIHARVECLRNCDHCPLARVVRPTAPCEDAQAAESREMAAPRPLG